MGRTLIIAGVVIAVAGVIVNLLQVNGIPRLPGDIYIKRDSFTFYFPLGWCVLISLLLGLINWVIGR